MPAYPAVPSPSPRSTSVFATAYREREPVQVVFLLDGPHYRRRLVQQILWMRLDGLSISRIARETGLERETIQALIDLWQRQAEMAFKESFEPIATCPRREAGRKQPRAKKFEEKSVSMTDG